MIRVAGVDLSIDEIPYKRTPAPGTDFMKPAVFVTASGTPEGCLAGFHGTSVPFFVAAVLSV
jgi:hypothetical protein